MASETATATTTESPAQNPIALLESPAEQNAETALAIPIEAKISGARKAAIFCLSLGEDAAAALFKHLDEEEVQMLTRELALLPNVKSEVAGKVIEEFNQMLLARSYVQTGGVEYAKRLLNRTFGLETAKRLTDKVVHSLESPASFEVLQKTDPQHLAKLFQSEHPQTITVVLAHLDPSTAAEVLKQLPDEMRADIILRLSNLQAVSPDVVKRISQVFNQKLSSFGSNNKGASIGGVRAVAEICNRLDKEMMKAMMEKIEEGNPELSLEIRNLMVTFEDLLLVDDIGIREILQRVDKKALAMSLKGTVPELQDRFYSNMSSRAVEMMKEEMDFMGQVKMKEVTEAQREIVEVLRQLDEEGVISLAGAAGGDDEYVS
jgi:flagellar motor switch protein FliG